MEYLFWSALAIIVTMAVVIVIDPGDEPRTEPVPRCVREAQEIATQSENARLAREVNLAIDAVEALLAKCRQDGDGEQEVAS